MVRTKKDSDALITAEQLPSVNFTRRKLISESCIEETSINCCAPTAEIAMKNFWRIYEIENTKTKISKAEKQPGVI